MEYETMVQTVLDEIDRRIMDDIRVDELARVANYSVYHFCRVFMALTGTPVLAYVNKRKLECALYELAQGRRIIDVAIDYGFKNHSGFSRAFKKHYGYPPSLHRLHAIVSPPIRATLENVRKKHGRIKTQFQIKEIIPFTIVGVVSRHTLPNVKRSADIPAYWNTISMDYDTHLGRVYDAFTPAVHGEYSLCFDIDEATGEFTYIFGVEFDDVADGGKLEPDMRTIQIPGGTYAVFTMPKSPIEKYPEAITETWDEILTHWFPDSRYEYDETRLDFEAYDERDHAWLHDDMVQMDICIPIRERK